MQRSASRNRPNNLNLIATHAHNLVKQIGTDYMEEATNLSAGWQAIAGIRQAKELIRALDQMIEEKQGQLNDGPISDNRLNAMISHLEGLSYDVDFDEVGQGLNELGHLTQTAVDWCRTLGDWDKLRQAFGVA